jgi:hypothetical protein
LSEEDVLAEARGWPEDVVFFGGVKVSADRVVQLLKPYTVKLPNSRGATSSNQLLVGRIADVDATPPSEIVFEGPAYLGSIEFFPSHFGSFAVLSPLNGLGMVAGKFTTRAGAPIAGALVGTSASNPFVSITDQHGQYFIPAGPPQSTVAIIVSTLPNAAAGTSAAASSLGTASAMLPDLPPLWPTLPLGGPKPIEDLLSEYLDEVIDLVDGDHDLPDPPSECECDPPPAPPYFEGQEIQPDNRTFRMFPNQFVQTVIRTADQEYDEKLVVWSDFPADLLERLWSGETVAVFRVYSSDPSAVAYFDPTWPGRLFAAQPGDANISAVISLATQKDCSAQSPRKILCPTTLYAAGKVAVRCSYQGTAQPWWDPTVERCGPCPSDAPTWDSEQEQCMSCADGSVGDGDAGPCQPQADAGVDADAGTTPLLSLYQGTVTLTASVEAMTDPKIPFPAVTTTAPIEVQLDPDGNVVSVSDAPGTLVSGSLKGDQFTMTVQSSMSGVSVAVTFDGTRTGDVIAGQVSGGGSDASGLVVETVTGTFEMTLQSAGV